MKCVLVLSLVALCFAEVPLTAPSVTFGEDGTITVTGADGRKVIISNSLGNPGRKNVEISVPDPLGQSKSVKINQDYNVRTVNIDAPTTGNQDVEGKRFKRSSISKSSKESKTGKSEAEILDGIFREYQAAADLKSYEKVLKEIDSYIKSGDLDSSIYKVLKGFAQYEALNPEGSYFGQSTTGSEPGIGYSSRQAYLQNYLNRANGAQQGLNGPWYGVRQPVSELYQGPIYSAVSPYWYKGVNGASLQEYRDFYGQQQKNQVSPVQDVQQYLQPKWQPSYEPYQQQVYQPLQQLAQPQQQWTIPQSQWSLSKQQLAQEQDKFLWNQLQRQQQFTEPQQVTQPQQLPSQQVLTQPREQQNFLLPKRQLVQELPWNLAQKPQQYYGPQQQYYEPQQQYYGPQQQYYKSQQQYYGPQQQYYGPQEQYYGPQQQYYGTQQQKVEPQGYQQGKQLENQVYPQSQQIPNEQLWAQQQLAQEPRLSQEQQGLPLSRGQQIQSNAPLGNYWQRLWAPQTRPM